MGQSVDPKGFRLIKLKNWENRECVIEKERYIKSLNLQRDVEAYLENFFNRVLERRLIKSIKKVTKKRKLFRWYGRVYRGRVLSKKIRKWIKKIKNESLTEIGKRLSMGRKRGWRQQWKHIMLGMLKEVRREKRRERRELKKLTHWSRRFQYKRPNFLYSHTVFLRRNGKLELNVVLYTSIGIKRILKGKEKLIRGYYRAFLEKRWKEVFRRMLESRLSQTFLKNSLIKIHFIKGPWLNSSLCARYVVYQLKRRKGNFSKIVENLLYRPRYYGGYKHNLYGIFIAGAGRFTRRQRASYKKNQRGRVPYSTATAPVEYTDRSVPLKYGACSVRVWICHLRK